MISINGPVNIRAASLGFIDKLSPESSMEFREHVVKDSIQLIFRATVKESCFFADSEVLKHMEDILVRYGWFYYNNRDHSIFKFIELHLNDWLKYTSTAIDSAASAFVFSIVSDLKGYLINTPRL